MIFLATILIITTDIDFNERGAWVSAHFLEPYTLKNNITLRNRVIMAPMTINSSTTEGDITDEELAYYLIRSSAPGAVITAGAYVSSEGQAFKNGVSIAKDKFIPSLKKLSSVIQLQGSKAILQIYRRMAHSNLNLGRQPVAPSAIKANRPWAELPKELTPTDIELLIHQFGQAVRRAIQAGFDGVEIHGANTYLLQQFFSPQTNRRTDDWGGTFEKRLRFPLRIIEEAQNMARQYADDDFIIGYRLSPEEIETPGIRLEDTFQFIDAIIEAKIDYIHLSLKHYYQPSIVGIGNYHVNIPKEIYKHIDQRVPLINVGNITAEEDANKALEYSDLVTIGRQLIVDPQWIQKHQLKRKKEINKTIRLNQQSKLVIPDELWDVITSSPGWFPLEK